MNSSSQQFSIDDAFELAPEDGEMGNRFGSLNLNRRSGLSKGEGAAQGERESSLKYQNLDNDDGSGTNGTPASAVFKIRAPDQGLVSTGSSQWSFSTVSEATPFSHQECFSWTRHPLIQKNRKVVLACFLLLVLGLALVLAGIGVQVNSSSGLSSAIFYVPGFLLLIPGVYHVIFIYCTLQERCGFRFFYLPYIEK